VTISRRGRSRHAKGIDTFAAWRAFACPKCHAAIGRPCRNPMFQNRETIVIERARNPHQARRRLAGLK
jgi:hypothetical protein